MQQACRTQKLGSTWLTIFYLQQQHISVGNYVCLCEEYLVILSQLETFHNLKAFGHIDHLQASWSVACGDTADLTASANHNSTSALPSWSSTDSEPCRPMTPLPLGSCSKGVRFSGFTITNTYSMCENLASRCRLCRGLQDATLTFKKCTSKLQHVSNSLE